MKKMIFASGLTLALALLYFEVSCGKKEFASSFDYNEYQTSNELIKENHKVIFNSRLAEIFATISEVNENIQSSFLNSALDIANNEDKIIFREIQRLHLNSNNFDNNLIAIIAPNQVNSIIDIQKSIKYNTTLTYTQLINKINDLIKNIETLKNMLPIFINTIHNSKITLPAKEALIYGSSSNLKDVKINFLGYQIIHNKLDSIKF